MAKGRRKKTKWKGERKNERRGKKKKHERNKESNLRSWRQISVYLKLIFDRFISNSFEFIIYLSLCIRRYIIGDNNSVIYLFIYLFIHSFIHSVFALRQLHSLTKATSPPTVINFFLLQFPVSFVFLKVIQ